jgi:hypothetical protein
VAKVVEARLEHREATLLGGERIEMLLEGESLADPIGILRLHTVKNVRERRLLFAYNFEQLLKFRDCNKKNVL